MKLNKILIPALAVTSVATPVTILTSCASAPEENTHFKFEEVDKEMVMDYSFGFNYFYFKTTEELKADDLKVTAEVTQKNNYIQMLQCLSDYDTETKTLRVALYTFAKNDGFFQKEDQVLKYNIKIAYGTKWYQVEKDFSFKVNKV